MEMEQVEISREEAEEDFLEVDEPRVFLEEEDRVAVEESE